MRQGATHMSSPSFTAALEDRFRHLHLPDAEKEPRGVTCLRRGAARRQTPFARSRGGLEPATPSAPSLAGGGTHNLPSLVHVFAFTVLEEAVMSLSVLSSSG